MMRATSNAQDVVATLRMINSVDVRQILPSVRTRALIIHRKDCESYPLDHGRYLAEHLPDARLVVIPGSDPITFLEPAEETLQEIEAFLTGTPARTVSDDRVLAAVLFTDIAGSTERAAAIGDRRWQTLLESHDTIARGVVEQCEGRVIDLTGDGVLAIFEGPGRAVRCAQSLREALRTLAIEIRAGIHTGEVDLRGDEISGIGVHVAARVMQQAGPGEIIVSAVVPLLMAGSGVEFEPRGEWTLKGVPGEWALFEIKS
jgi:class 3 adenylate cyclase